MHKFELFLVALFARHQTTTTLEELCEEVHQATTQFLAEKSNVTDVHLTQMMILGEIAVPSAACNVRTFLEIAHCAATSLNWGQLNKNLKAELAFNSPPTSKDLQ